MPGYRTCGPYAHFCTISVLEWLPLFIERRYCDPIFESLRFCRDNKRLRVMAYVLMPNHLHLIAEAGEDLECVIRDFKRFTSRTTHDLLRADGRQTLLQWLFDATEPARRAKGELGLWRPGFHPQAITNSHMFYQKLRYIHENPVRKGLVVRAEDWWYSSARIEAGLPDYVMDIDRWD